MQRMTKQRQAVLDELTRVSDFRSAQQIFGLCASCQSKK